MAEATRMISSLPKYHIVPQTSVAAMADSSHNTLLPRRFL